MLISHLDDAVISGSFVTERPGIHGQWRAIPYATDGFDGVLPGCGHGISPNPSTLELGVRTDRIASGWACLARSGHTTDSTIFSKNSSAYRIGGDVEERILSFRSFS